ncbi:MAG: dynamin family protein [Actinomycetota bacterium]|nr:dynamin family protein [Actinomycetota bacterium]
MTRTAAGDVGSASGGVAARLSEICSRVHRADLVARLRPALDSLDGDGITVVVAGESQRGKSTLINSLLDAPGLLPAGSEHATAVPISVVAGTVGRAEVHRPGRPPIPMAVGDLEAYLSGTSPESDSADCVDAVVEHDHPLLRAGLRLVDTPGFGGLEAGQAMLTLAALSRAEALLFVVDPTVPLTRGELAFVVSAAQRTTVIFVLARIDGAGGWREILEHDRRLVAEHAPQLSSAPWFAVSAELKSIAARIGSGAEDSVAGRAQADSGMSELGSALRDQLVAESRAVRAANLRRVCRGVIEALAEPEQAMLASLDGTTDNGALEAERANLLELLGKSSRWRADLDLEMRRLSIDIETETEFAFTELSRRLEQRIATDKRLAPDRLVNDLDAEIAATWVEVDRFLQDRMVTIVDGIVEQLEFAGAAPAVGHLLMPDRVREVIRDWRSTGPAKAGGAETIMQYYPVIFSGGLVATISTYMSSLFTVTANPMQIAVGGIATMGATFTARRTAIRRSSNRQEAFQIVRNALGQARSSIAKQVSRQVVDSRAAIEAGITAELDNRRSLLAQREADERTIPKDGPARQKAIDRCRQRLGSLNQLGQQLDQVEQSRTDWEPLGAENGPNTLTKVVAMTEEAG